MPIRQSGEMHADKSRLPEGVDDYRRTRELDHLDTISMPESTDNGEGLNFQRKIESGACGRGAFATQSEFHHMLPGSAMRIQQGGFCKRLYGLLRNERRVRGRSERLQPAGNGERLESRRLALETVLTARTALISAGTDPAGSRGLTRVLSWRHG